MANLAAFQVAMVAVSFYAVQQGWLAASRGNALLLFVHCLCMALMVVAPYEYSWPPATCWYLIGIGVTIRMAWRLAHKLRFARAVGDMADFIAILFGIGCFIMLGLAITPWHFEISYVLFLLLVALMFAAALQRNRELNASVFRLSREQAETIEAERRRFADELHDGVGQYLATAKLLVSSANAAQPSEPLAKSVSLLGDATEEVRRVVRNARPLALEVETSLVNALRSECERLANASAVPIDFLVQGNHELVIEDRAQQQVMRILQEALQNAMKYSQASLIEVQVQQYKRRFKLSIRDNGKGFRVSDSSQQGAGIRNMRDRALLLRGQLELRSVPDNGTEVSLVFG